MNAIIKSVDVAGFTIPTDFPEADGTYEWKETTLIVVRVKSEEQEGLGYSYSSVTAAQLVDNHLASHVVGADAMSPRAVWNQMYRSVRNLGRDGIASTAISAVDTAVWDLKARCLGCSMVGLLGQVRESIPVYGSGGFTSYSDEQLTSQLACWVASGIRSVKMKIGSEPERDVKRVRAARAAIGDAALYVDANGAYNVKQALDLASEFSDYGVTWFEEPVSADDLTGLRFIRERSPLGMEIAAGEYGYNQRYFRHMLQSGAVDVLQADATRCGGVTGFLLAADIADNFGRPLSAHTAPALHGSLCCAATRARNVEYFHDHARIERMLFEGGPALQNGDLIPDRSLEGLGLVFKDADARRFQVFRGEKHA